MHKITLFLTIVGIFLFTLTYFQKGVNPRDSHLFLMVEPPFLAIDQQTFNNDLLFERMTFLTSSAISVKSVLRQFSKPITAITASIQEPEKIYLTQGFNIIEISSGPDKTYHLQEKMKHPLVALSVHPFNPHKIYALTKDREFYILTMPHSSSDSIQVKRKDRLTSLPQNMVIEEMWINPISATLTIALSQNEDTLLVSMDPENETFPIQEELTLPSIKVKAGFQLSQELMVLLDHHYQLYVIDREKKMIIGKYLPNQNFKDFSLYKQRASGLTLSQRFAYLTDDQGNVIKMSWKTNNNVIIVNKDFTFQKGKLILSWKTPVKNTKTLYLGEISLTPQKRSKMQVSFGPLKKQSLELPYPYTETGSRKYDISLMGIHHSNGKMIAPLMTFTIDTEKGVHP